MSALATAVVVSEIVRSTDPPQAPHDPPAAAESDPDRSSPTCGHSDAARSWEFRGGRWRAGWWPRRGFVGRFVQKSGLTPPCVSSIKPGTARQVAMRVGLAGSASAGRASHRPGPV